MGMMFLPHIAGTEMLEEKKNKLAKLLRHYQKMIIAFSGGADSTFLLATACKILEGNVIAATYASPFHPDRETRAAVALAKQFGVPHRLIRVTSIGPKALADNPIDRCYICKKRIGAAFQDLAISLDIETVAHGENLDDRDDYRPGSRAAKEMGWVAPLAQAGFRKIEIRNLSKAMGLPTWNKPAMPCLATRIPYGTPITLKALQMVEQSETYVLSMGFSDCRIRYHGDIARIEVPIEEIGRIITENVRERIVQKLREIGFRYISIDLEGYVPGSMNRGIVLPA